MLNKKMAFGIPVVDKSGKASVKNMWMHNVMWEFENQFADEKNNALMYGRSNRNSNGSYLNIGQSGNVIKQGDGKINVTYAVLAA